jgi:hypothetical protein
MDMHDLAARLEAIVAHATAVTLGEETAAAIDEVALLAALATACKEAFEYPAEMTPVLQRIEAALDDALTRAEETLANAATTYRFTTIKWRPDPPAMPREIVAFVVRDRLHATRVSCGYLVAKARYESLRRPEDRCDCAARIESSFLHHRPEGPLELIDSAGVPHAAMDYLWRCQACGTRWHEEEAHDDMGSRSSWRLASADATKA